MIHGRRGEGKRGSSLRKAACDSSTTSLQHLKKINGKAKFQRGNSINKLSLLHSGNPCILSTAPRRLVAAPRRLAKRVHDAPGYDITSKYVATLSFSMPFKRNRERRTAEPIQLRGRGGEQETKRERGRQRQKKMQRKRCGRQSRSSRIASGKR